MNDNPKPESEIDTFFNRCLTYMKHDSDEAKLAGLLLVSKQLQLKSNSNQNNVVQSEGENEVEGPKYLKTFSNENESNCNEESILSHGRSKAMMKALGIPFFQRMLMTDPDEENDIASINYNNVQSQTSADDQLLPNLEKERTTISSTQSWALTILSVLLKHLYNEGETEVIAEIFPVLKWILRIWDKIDVNKKIHKGEESNDIDTNKIKILWDCLECFYYIAMSNPIMAEGLLSLRIIGRICNMLLIILPYKQNELDDKSKPNTMNLENKDNDNDDSQNKKKTTTAVETKVAVSTNPDKSNSLKKNENNEAENETHINFYDLYLYACSLLQQICMIAKASSNEKPISKCILLKLDNQLDVSILVKAMRKDNTKTKYILLDIFNSILQSHIEYQQQIDGIEKVNCNKKTKISKQTARTLIFSDTTIDDIRDTILGLQYGIPSNIRTTILTISLAMFILVGNGWLIDTRKPDKAGEIKSESKNKKEVAPGKEGKFSNPNPENSVLLVYIGQCTNFKFSLEEIEYRLDSSATEEGTFTSSSSLSSSSSLVLNDLESAIEQVQVCCDLTQYFFRGLCDKPSGMHYYRQYNNDPERKWCNLSPATLLLLRDQIVEQFSFAFEFLSTIADITSDQEIALDKNGRKKLEMDILQPLYELIGIYVREDDEGISFPLLSKTLPKIVKLSHFYPLLDDEHFLSFSFLREEEYKMLPDNPFKDIIVELLPTFHRLVYSDPQLLIDTGALNCILLFLYHGGAGLIKKIPEYMLETKEGKGIAETKIQINIPNTNAFVNQQFFKLPQLNDSIKSVLIFLRELIVDPHDVGGIKLVFPQKQIYNKEENDIITKTRHHFDGEGKKQIITEQKSIKKKVETLDNVVYSLYNHPTFYENLFHLLLLLEDYFNHEGEVELQCYVWFVIVAILEYGSIVSISPANDKLNVVANSTSSIYTVSCASGNSPQETLMYSTNNIPSQSQRFSYALQRFLLLGVDEDWWIYEEEDETDSKISQDYKISMLWRDTVLDMFSSDVQIKYPFLAECSLMNVTKGIERTKIEDLLQHLSLAP